MRIADCLKPKDDNNFIPVIDCPSCGQLDAPLTAFDFIADGIPMTTWFCPVCSYVPISDNEIKGYVGITEISEYEIDYGCDFENSGGSLC